MTSSQQADQEDHSQQDTSGFSFQAWINNVWTERTQKLFSIWGKRVLLAVVFGVLLYKLSGVGWVKIWNDIPVQPLFYLIFVAMYLGLPVAETIIYRLIWGLPYREIFPMMIKKRVFNKDVVNYSGEANLFLWARKRMDRSSRLILRDIKDNTIISSLTSMLIALGLLSTFLFSGVLPLEELTSQLETSWVIAGGFCLALLISLAIRFRKSVIALPGGLVLKLFGTHVGRLILVQTLQVLQWMVVMPDIPVAVWFTLLSTQIVANQIPLMPSKDLLVVAASAEIAGWLDVSESGITGMLLVTAVLDRVVNFILFSFLTAKENDEFADQELAEEEVNDS